MMLILLCIEAGISTVHMSNHALKRTATTQDIIQFRMSIADFEGDFNRLAAFVDPFVDPPGNLNWRYTPEVDPARYNISSAGTFWTN